MTNIFFFFDTAIWTWEILLSCTGISEITVGIFAISPESERSKWEGVVWETHAKSDMPKLLQFSYIAQNSDIALISFSIFYQIPYK